MSKVTTTKMKRNRLDKRRFDSPNPCAVFCGLSVHYPSRQPGFRTSLSCHGASVPCQSVCVRRTTRLCYLGMLDVLFTCHWFIVRLPSWVSLHTARFMRGKGFPWVVHLLVYYSVSFNQPCSCSSDISMHSNTVFLANTTANSGFQ
jgi:hypothetical protein